MKNVQDYLQLPYRRVIEPIRDESGAYFVATVAELDGCRSTGRTADEAASGLREAMEGWIETRLSNGFSIPEPAKCKYCDRQPSH